MSNRLKELANPHSDARTGAAIIHKQLEEIAALKAELEKVRAQLREQSRYKTSASQRAATKRWIEKNKPAHNAKMREYMRKRRAAQRDKQPPL